MEGKKVLTDIEYDIIDELYFVTHYQELKEQLTYSDEEIRKVLIALIEKEWIRVYKSVDEESEVSNLNINNDFKSFFYLASKKGLFAHNKR